MEDGTEEGRKIKKLAIEKNLVYEGNQLNTFLASFSSQFDEVAWCIFIHGVSFYIEICYINL